MTQDLVENYKASDTYLLNFEGAFHAFKGEREML